MFGPTDRRRALAELGCDPALEPREKGTIADPAPQGLSRGFTAAPALRATDLEVRELPEVSDRLRPYRWSVTASAGEDGHLAISARGMTMPAQTPDLRGVKFEEAEALALIEVRAFQGGVRFRGEETECDLVVLPSEAGGVSWELRETPELEVPPLPRLESPLRKWLDEEEEWLRSACERLLATEEPYDHLAALGLLARLRRLSAEQRKANLAAVLGANPLPHPCPVRAWIGELSSEELDYLQRAALVEALQLDQDLDQLVAGRAAATGENAEASEAEQTLILLELLHARDRLQGVALLLEAAGSLAADLCKAIELVDKRGEVLARTFAFPSATEDLHLERVGELEPDQWWFRAMGSRP